MAVEKIPRSVGVHDGTFHADEVTACALLILFDCVDVDKIIRSRDPNILEKCTFVCDVGGEYNPEKKLFDHHQVGYKGSLSSAGMILRYLLDEKILSESEYNHFEHMIIHGVDAHDNGRITHEVGTCTFSHIIATMTPVSYEASPEEQNQAFRQALEFALGHLSRLRNKYLYEIECRKEVAEAMDKYQTCLYFTRSIPWLENFFALGGEKHPAQFVIMPAGEHWKLRGIPPSLNRRMEVRRPLPAKWAGLLERELKEVTGIEGAVFCHKGRFTSVWETKEDAIQALNLVLKDESGHENIV